MKPFDHFLKEQAETLPRLPVPPLDETVKRFLKSAKPFLTPQEYETTEKKFKDFTARGGVGEKLQTLLENRAKNTDNWLLEWWLHVVYLDSRLPLPVYSSTGVMFPQQPEFRSQQEHIDFAALLIASVLDFKDKMENNELPLEKMGPYTLDMSQLKYMCGTIRIPGEKTDRLILSETYSEHVLVAHNNHLFAVPVYDEKGEVLNQRQLASQLRLVLEQSAAPSACPVGILTSEKRPEWARAREALLQASPENRRYLELIERALFAVCLDGPLTREELQRHGTRMNANAARLMHGGGLLQHSANRWFDIAFQFLITRSGEVGFNFEHTPGEAHPNIMNHIETYWVTKNGPKDPVPPAGKYPSPEQLAFTVPSSVQEAIRTAELNFSLLAASFDVQCFVFRDYGRDFIRSLGLGSVDSFIQMAIQLAFYSIHKTPGAQYESATAHVFLYGRTETIRSCSEESVNFARTMLDPVATDQSKFETLKTAMDAHREYVMKALAAHGVDRHLLGLRLIAAENGIPVPEIFMDPAYTRSGHMRLSTSQVPSQSETLALFGPLVGDGYGCCYNPRPGSIVFGATALHSCPETSASRFGHALEQALNHMKRLATHVSSKEKL